MKYRLIVGTFVLLLSIIFLYWIVVCIWVNSNISRWIYTGYNIHTLNIKSFTIYMQTIFKLPIQVIEFFPFLLCIGTVKELLSHYVPRSFEICWDYIAQVEDILNFKVLHNCIISSKVTAILLNRWILPIVGVALERVCSQLENQQFLFVTFLALSNASALCNPSSKRTNKKQVHKSTNQKLGHNPS